MAMYVCVSIFSFNLLCNRNRYHEAIFPSFLSKNLNCFCLQVFSFQPRIGGGAENPVILISSLRFIPFILLQIISEMGASHCSPRNSRGSVIRRFLNLIKSPRTQRIFYFFLWVRSTLVC